MRVLAAVAGLWIVLALCLGALIARGSRGLRKDDGELQEVGGERPRLAAGTGDEGGRVLARADAAPARPARPWPATGAPARTARVEPEGPDPPGDEQYFRAIASAEGHLRTFERHRRPEDRDRFLEAMAALVRLGDAWITWRPPSMGMPEDVRATLIRCVDARDELLPTVVASNQAWKQVARAVSHARRLPDVRDADREDLGRLEEHAWTRVMDLATFTRVPDGPAGEPTRRDA